MKVNMRNSDVSVVPDKIDQTIYFNGQGIKFCDTEIMGKTNYLIDTSRKYMISIVNSQILREERYANREQNNYFLAENNLDFNTK